MSLDDALNMNKELCLKYFDEMKINLLSEFLVSNIFTKNGGLTILLL